MLYFQCHHKLHRHPGSVQTVTEKDTNAEISVHLTKVNLPAAIETNEQFNEPLLIPLHETRIIV